MSQRILCAALASSILLGCDDKPTSSASASAVPADIAVDKLEATLNDKPVAFKTALVMSFGGRALSVLLSTANVSCEAATAGARMMAPDEIAVKLSLAPRLAADGSEVWTLTDSHLDGMRGNSDVPGKLVVPEAVDASRATKLELDLTRQFAASPALGTPERKLALRGSFTAHGCGSVENGNAPRSQGKLTVKLAGKTFQMNGALLERHVSGEGSELRLSTRAASCKRHPVDNDLAMELLLGAEGRVTMVAMRGELLPKQYSKGLGPNDPPATYKAAGPLEGEGEVEVEVSLNDSVVGYPLEVKGTATALRCPKTD